MSGDGEVRELEYRELQALCKKHGVSGKGKREDLELRLSEAQSGLSAGGAATTTAGTTTAGASVKSPGGGGATPRGGTTTAASSAGGGAAPTTSRRSRRLKDEEPLATPDVSRSRRTTRSLAAKDAAAAAASSEEEGEDGVLPPPGGKGHLGQLGSAIEAALPDEGPQELVASPARRLVAQVRRSSKRLSLAAKQRVQEAWDHPSRTVPYGAVALAVLVFAVLAGWALSTRLHAEARSPVVAVLEGLQRRLSSASGGAWEWARAATHDLGNTMVRLAPTRDSSPKHIHVPPPRPANE